MEMSNLQDVIGLRLPYGPTRREVDAEFEPATGTIWGFTKPKGTPCFTLSLLKDMYSLVSEIAEDKGRVNLHGTWHDARYFVGASRTPGVYNLGGDLGLFVLLIKSRDRDALAGYAKLCLDVLHLRMQNHNCPTLTTISLVQGDALGGGFESALASDVIVAEESAQMGFPEILFNLFPGMGGYSLLARRIGQREAERLVVSGRVYPAAKLHELGIVDVLAKDGQGESAVRQWIATNDKRRNGLQGIMQARKLVSPITRAELDAIADVWVDAALRLTDRDLKMMSFLLRAQMRRMQYGDVSDITAEVREPAAQAV